MVDKVMVAGFLIDETCDFLKVFENTAPLEAPYEYQIHPVAKIGYVRADFDGHRWWGQYFPTRDALKTTAFSAESQKIYNDFVAEFKNLHQLGEYCLKHPNAKISPDEYNFYISGEVADYWLRLTTRSGDYNLYMHGFVKTDRNTGEILK